MSLRRSCRLAARRDRGHRWAVAEPGQFPGELAHVKPHPAQGKRCPSEVVSTFFTVYQGRAPRAGPGLAAVHAKAPHDGGADCVAAQHPPTTGWPARGPWRTGRRLPSFGPSGHVGADAHSSPAADRTGSAPQRQQWRAGLQTGPSLRHPIMKPCKIAGKGAPAARRLLTQAQTLPASLDKDSAGANRRDGQVRARPGSVAGFCSNSPAPPRPDPAAVMTKKHVTHHPSHRGWRWHASRQGGRPTDIAPSAVNAGLVSRSVPDTFPGPEGARRRRPGPGRGRTEAQPPEVVCARVCVFDVPARLE